MASERWGEWLSGQLEARGWRQADLVKAADEKLARQSVSKWVNGDNTADPDAAIVVAEALQVDPVEALRAAGHHRIANLLNEPNLLDRHAVRRRLEYQYHVVLQDSDGEPGLGFRDGTWFLIPAGHQPLSLLNAIAYSPHACGSIVQISCWWMRENSTSPRALDVSTELALAVGALVKLVPSSDLVFEPPLQVAGSEEHDAKE